jgi:LysR family transcriptional regulator, nitrogen assimilation regulatory protein
VDIRQLANFVQIVDAGSLTRAATTIGVAQPALTFQIARLEEELGCQLLIRSTRGVHPTEPGTILYREAHTILRQLQRIPQTLRAALGDPRGEVAIGFPNSLAPFFSSEVAAAVQKRYPHVKLHIFEGESVVQREQIAKNRLELAFICEHHPAPELHHRLLFKQRLAMLCDGRNEKDKAGEPIELAEAANRVVGLPSAGNPVRTAFDAAVQLLGLKVEARLEFNAMRTLSDAVERGLGASINLWIPMQESRERPGVVCRPITNPEIWLDISLCRSKISQLSLPATMVEEIMAQVALDRVNRSDWPGAKSH